MKYRKTKIYAALLIIVGGATAFLSGGFYLQNTALFNTSPLQGFKELLVNYWFMFIPFLFIAFEVIAHTRGEGYQEIDLSNPR